MHRCMDISASIYLSVYLRVFANGPGDLGLISGHVISKT